MAPKPDLPPWIPSTLTPTFLGDQNPTATGVASTTSGSVISISMSSPTDDPNNTALGISATKALSEAPGGFTSPPFPIHTGSRGDDDGSDNYGSSKQSGGRSPHAFAAAGAVGVLLVIIAFFGICCFTLRKKRRAQARAAGANAALRGGTLGQEMSKTVAEHRVSLSNSQPYLQPPTSPPPAMTIGSPISASSLPSSATNTSNVDNPVILSTVMDQSYYTGLDTSDHISLADNRSSRLSSEGYADSTDEPPPPYRPRSVPPISRETSLRVSNGLNLLHTQAQQQQNQDQHSRDVRSPFDDPIPGYQSGGVSPVDEEEAGAVAGLSLQMGSLISHRDLDRMSDVSDLSYQEPVVGHSTV